MKIALVLLLLIGCKSPFAPSVYTVYNPPPIYQQWWDSVEVCSGFHANLSRIRWAVVPADINNVAFNCNGVDATGCWVAPHYIYMADGETNFEGMIKHEMLHDLLQSGDHPSPPFGACTNGI